MPDTTDTTGSSSSDEQSRPGDGSIPTGPTGVGVGAGEASTFEPEEDPESAAQRTGGEPEAEGSEGDSA